MRKGKNNKLKEHAQLLAAKLGADQQSNGALKDGFRYLCKSSQVRSPPKEGRSRRRTYAQILKAVRYHFNPKPNHYLRLSTTLLSGLAVTLTNLILSVVRLLRKNG